jgi:hypothetical protein
MNHGAKVPAILKWAQFYYFERLDGATYMMEKGMNPNTMSWHHVTLLHDMAQKGDIKKAEITYKAYGADYRSCRRRVPVNSIRNGIKMGSCGNG